ncbi:hypothetical protein F5B17DRAFT_427452 [Nemania serpens]|nr:hypothetical protein F5B17DRAFT_427452 [Nemania serpens]
MPPLPPPRIVAPWRPLLPTHPTPPRSRPRYSIPIFKSLETLRSRALVGADTVPQGYGNAPFGPDPGTVVGIVLGSVAGFVLLLAFIYWCINIGQGPRMLEEGSVGGGTASVVSWRRSRGPPRKHARHSKHAGRREKIEIRRSRPVPVVVEQQDQIIVEEFQSGSRSRSRSRPRISTQRPPPQRRSDGDDMIVVEEEPPSPRRRRDSMRSQRTRRSDDRRGSFREEVYIRT